MSYEIRAMSLSEILDTGFRVVRDHFAVLLPISLLTYLPVGGAFALMMGFIDPASGEIADLEADEIISMVAWSVGMLLFLSLVFPLVWTSTAVCAREAYLGRPVGFGEALRLGAEKYLHFVWVFTVMTFVIFGAMILLMTAGGALVLVLPGGLEGLEGFGPGIALGLVLAFLAFIAFFLAAIWLYAFGFFVTIVSVTEELGAMDTLRRCWWLVNTARWRVLGLALVVYIISVIPASGTQMLMSFMPLAGGLLWGAVQGIAFTYVVATFVVFYYEILCREEAFDLEHLAQRVEGEPVLDPHARPDPVA